MTFFIIDGPNCLLSRHAIENLWPDVYRTLIAGTGCDKGAQKNKCDTENSQVQTLAVHQAKPEIIESSGVISDNVVRQTQSVEKSDVTVTTTSEQSSDKNNTSKSNKTKKSDVSKSDKKKSNMTDKGKSSQQKVDSIKSKVKKLGNTDENLSS